MPVIFSNDGHDYFPSLFAIEYRNLCLVTLLAAKLRFSN